MHEAGQPTNMTTNGWTAGTGVLNAVVHDLDHDGEDELLVVMIQKKDASINSSKQASVYPEFVVYESSSGKIMEADRVGLDTMLSSKPKVASIAAIDYNDSLCCLSSLYLYKAADKLYLCAELFDYAVFATGYDYGYFFLEYDGEHLHLNRYVYSPPGSGVEALYYGVKTGNEYQENLAYSDYPTTQKPEYTGEDPIRWIMNKLGIEDEPETDAYLEEHLTWKNSDNSTFLSEIRITAPQTGRTENEFTYIISNGEGKS